MTRRRSRNGGRGARGASRRPPLPDAVGGAERLESWPDGDWMVRQVTGAASTKSYRCPGCDQLITPATPHVVTWPAERSLLGGESIDERRHWHTTCWRARDRRRRK